MTPMLQARDVQLSVPVNGAMRQILRGVTLDIDRGEMVGLVGESGSGKSMFARTLIRTLPAGSQVQGTVLLDNVALLDLSAVELRELRAQRVGMIFQDPRAHINPVRTIGDHLTETLRFIRGQSRSVADARAAELLDAVRIPNATRLLRRYPHELSGGMLQRVMIAGALAGEPELILADEPTTALDTTIQEEVVAVLAELRAERNLAVLLITHNLELAAAVCDRTTVMYAGHSVEAQVSSRLHEAPRHPYTAALLASRPGIHATGARLKPIRGVPIAAYEVSGGCAFAPRCDFAKPACQTIDPAYEDLGQSRVACLRSEEIVAELKSAGGEVTRV